MKENGKKHVEIVPTNIFPWHKPNDKRSLYTAPERFGKTVQG
jgi:hypothetical protein